MTSGREDYDDFLEWLEDHNWCKVTNCCMCQYWSNSGMAESFRYFPEYGTCDRTEEVKCYDDYCSEAREVKK